MGKNGVGDPNGPNKNGLYYILIAPGGNDPLNKFGNSIFPCGCTVGVLYPQTNNTVIDGYRATLWASPGWELTAARAPTSRS